jgi:hypothetical protein
MITSLSLQNVPAKKDQGENDTEVLSFINYHRLRGDQATKKWFPASPPKRWSKKNQFSRFCVGSWILCGENMRREVRRWFA